MDQTKPSAAFVGASWFALLLGASAYLIGLWNAQMQLNEKGYYFTLLLYGLFAAVSVQKSVRDRMEGIPVTNIYYGLSWFAVLSALLLFIGLWSAGLALSEKGFYGMAYALSLFAAIAVQKNTRDSLRTRWSRTPRDGSSGAPPKWKADWQNGVVQSSRGCIPLRARRPIGWVATHLRGMA